MPLDLQRYTLNQLWATPPNTLVFEARYQPFERLDGAVPQWPSFERLTRQVTPQGIQWSGLMAGSDRELHLDDPTWEPGDGLPRQYIRELADQIEMRLCLDVQAGRRAPEELLGLLSKVWVRYTLDTGDDAEHWVDSVDRRVFPWDTIPTLDGVWLIDARPAFAYEVAAELRLRERAARRTQRQAILPTGQDTEPDFADLPPF